MRYLLGVLVALVAFSGVAYAGDPFANYYDNMVTVTNANGSRTVLINSDGTFTQKTADGKVATGTWKIDGDKACFAVTGAAPDAKPYCVPAVSHGVGDTWDLTAPDGTAEKATLSAGR